MDIETDGSADAAEEEVTVEAASPGGGGAQQNVASSDSATSEGSFASSSSSGKVLATPAVRNMAAKHKIDLSQIPGSGKEGRVLKEDVLRFIEQGGAAAAATVAAPATTTTPAPRKPAAAPAAAPAPAAKRPLPVTSVAVSGGAGDVEKPFDAFTKAMFKKMSESLSIPHFAYKDEVDMTELTALRAQLKKEYPDLKSVKWSLD